MASRDYCTSVADELARWSIKLHNLSSEIDKIPSIDKYRMFSQIEGLHIIMTELDDRLCELLESCPTASSSSSEEGKGNRERFSSPLNMSKSEHFDYDFGG